MPADTAVKTLNARVSLSIAALAAVMAMLLFVPAGTIRYWQGWLYLFVFFGASVLVTIFLVRHDPALLERRMRGGPTAEKRPTQQVIMLGASAGFLALLVVPAFDYRFGWSTVPWPGVLLGDLLVAIGFFFIFIVYKANTYAAATIDLAADQKVISTGPYAIVRHPMYASASLYLVGTPLALGSYWGLVVIPLMLPFLIWRLLDEERFLAKDLPGYVEYQQTVRHRLIPGVW